MSPPSQSPDELSELLHRASELFGRGLSSYYPGVPDDAIELRYAAWATISVALTLAEADLAVVEAFDIRQRTGFSQAQLVLYRRRYLEYAPLLIENVRLIAPTGALADALDDHILGVRSRAEGHMHAIATYCLVAAELVEAAIQPRGDLTTAKPAV